MSQLGANALGEVLEPGRVPDCYLGLRLEPASAAQVAGVLVVTPAVLRHPVVPQPDDTVLYELVAGHPDRTPQELVFIADLTVELWAWPADTWSKVGVDPQAAAQAVVAGWRRGDLSGRGLGWLTAQEAMPLGTGSRRPATARPRPPSSGGPPSATRSGALSGRSPVVRTAGRVPVGTTAADTAAGHGWRLLPQPARCANGWAARGISAYPLCRVCGWASIGNHLPLLGVLGSASAVGQTTLAAVLAIAAAVVGTLDAQALLREEGRNRGHAAPSGPASETATRQGRPEKGRPCRRGIAGVQDPVAGR